MGILSLILSLTGAVLTVIHYMVNVYTQFGTKMILGVIITSVFILAIIISAMDLKKQKQNGEIKASFKNFALVGFAIATVLLVVGGVICGLAWVKYPIE